MSEVDPRTDSWLIHAIVQQTMVLIARIATRKGRRAHLADVANRVFLDLVEQLEQSGVSQKVIADMFGLALRTYQRRRQRMLQSRSEATRTLWEALLAFIDERGTVTRRAILDRFRWDEEPMVRSLLRDLVESDLVFRTGSGDRSRYRLVEPEADEAAPVEVAVGHVWLAIYRDGPLAREALASRLSMREPVLDAALARLIQDGRIESGGDGYRCQAYLIPYGARAAWSAAVFDHYQAMVSALTAKLGGDARADLRDSIGGSTFRLSVWPGHPFEREALDLLAEQRTRVQALRQRIDRYNAQHPHDGPNRQVVVYLGQNVIDDDEEDEEG